MKVKEEANATKERRGPAQALELARAAGRIVVAKGKKVTVLDMKKDAPDDEMLLKYLLGPSGNLRAPTMRRGKTLFVGFHEEEFPALLTGGKT